MESDTIYYVCTSHLCNVMEVQKKMQKNANSADHVMVVSDVYSLLVLTAEEKGITDNLVQFKIVQVKYFKFTFNLHLNIL